MRLQLQLHAAGVLAPGVGSLDDLLALARTGAVAASADLPLPSPAALPPNERRRASQAVRLTLACAEQALRASPFAADRLRTVFASDEGTGEICQQMLEALATTRLVSPLLFHNSVHNAPSGYFSIAHRSRQSATSVSLGVDSFAAGLLCAAAEAHGTGQPVLLMAYDPVMTGPMRSLLPVAQATATAWIVSAPRTQDAAPQPLAEITLELLDASADTDPLPAWATPWAANSSARALQALAVIAGAQTSEAGAAGVTLALGERRLRVERVWPSGV
jgi:hypothetical protein